MRVAVTADLHWGHNAAGDAATLELIEHLRRRPPDVLLLGGDIGTAGHFASCLALFREFTCAKALIPGNHDLWVNSDDARGDSLQVYREHLPALSAAHDFHFLDRAPLVFAEQKLAVVGTINWYDYSWSLPRLMAEVPDWETRLKNMAFTRGRHNDRRFVRWDSDDVRFTADVVGVFEQQLRATLGQGLRAIVLTHHPAYYDLSFPRLGPPSVPDGLLWDAFSGNTRIESILRHHAANIDFIFSGHTHRARDSRLEGVRGINIGGDYPFKRLATIDWPEGNVEFQQFGA